MSDFWHPGCGPVRQRGGGGHHLRPSLTLGRGVDYSERACDGPVAPAGALIRVGAVGRWGPTPHRPSYKLLPAGLVAAEAITVGGIMTTASSAPSLLRRAHSPNELVGSETRLRRSRPVGPSLPGVQVV